MPVIVTYAMITLTIYAIIRLELLRTSNVTVFEQYIYNSKLSTNIKTGLLLRC